MTFARRFSLLSLNSSETRRRIIISSQAGHIVVAAMRTRLADEEAGGRFPARCAHGQKNCCGLPFPVLRRVNPNKRFGILVHGPPSVHEARLGPPEQPSYSYCTLGRAADHGPGQNV